MAQGDFSASFVFDRTPEEVYAAVNDVRGWWSRGVEGATERVGDEFTYRHKDLHRSRQRVIEAVPGGRVVWRVLDADLAHAKERGEWTGTEVRFEIVRLPGETGDKTELRFTHVGLRPELTCFESCSKGWQFYVGESLRRRIMTGEGTPDPEEWS